MDTTEDIKSLSISELLVQFENNIRYGCHSTLIEIGRSQDAKELWNRPKEEVKPILLDRWKRMKAQPIDDVDTYVCEAISIFIQLIDQN